MFFFKKDYSPPLNVLIYYLNQVYLLEYPREILSYVVNLLINQQFSIEL